MYYKNVTAVLKKIHILQMAHIQPCWFFCLSVCLVLYALLYYVDVVVKSNFFYSRTISHLSGFVSSSKFICIKAGMVGAWAFSNR